MTTLNVRIDENVKKKASKTLASLGLDMSSAVKLFLNQVIIEKDLPFVPTRNKRAIELRKKWDQEVSWALKHGNSYKNAEELLKDLL